MKQKIASVFKKKGAFISFIFALSLGTLSACIPIRETVEPIPSEYFAGDGNAELLIILLPGIRESPTAFVKNGVVEAINECRPKADVLGLDAHFGYYKERSVEQRIFQDVISKATNENKKIWLIGNSLGGLGSLISGLKHPDKIEWIALMAPYIGDKDELRAFVEKDQKAIKDVDPAFIELWETLSSDEWKLPKTSLGYGKQDRFSYQHQWLSSLLPEDQVFSVEGKHRWSVWKELWPSVIQKSGLCIEGS